MSFEEISKESEFYQEFVKNIGKINAPFSDLMTELEIDDNASCVKFSDGAPAIAITNKEFNRNFMKRDNELQLASILAKEATKFFRNNEIDFILKGNTLLCGGLLELPMVSRWYGTYNLTSYKEAYFYLIMNFNSISEKYARKACWLMNQSTFEKLNDTDFYWNDGLKKEKGIYSLKGNPIRIINQIPDRVLAFGDWEQAYYIVRVPGFKIFRTYTGKKVSFKVTRKLGGRVARQEAMRLLFV